MNRRYAIKRNDRNEQPSNLIFVDTETIPDELYPDLAAPACYHRLRLGVAIGIRHKRDGYYGRVEHNFKTSSSFWQFAIQRARQKEPVHIFAHNWHYDAQALEVWKYIDQGLFRLTITGRTKVCPKTGKVVPVKDWKGLAAIEDRPFILYLVSRWGTFKLIDTLNYWPLPLAELGNSFDIPKMTMPKYSDSDDDWFNYCRNDSVIIETAIRDTMSEWYQENRGNWQPTAARLAMSNYRHSHMSVPIIIDKDKSTKEVKEFERAAYFGGEVRCFFKGIHKGPLYHVDCTGLFPSRMMIGNYPAELLEYNPNETRVQDLLPQSQVAEVTLRSDQREYPVRCKLGNTYPTGLFSTFLCGPELQQAINTGQVLNCHRSISYRVEPIFSEYVGYWWRIRQQAKLDGNVARDLLAKMMLNTLYGKFASKVPAWTIESGIIPPYRWGTFVMPHPKTGKLVNWRAIAGTSQLNHKDEEREDSFTAISAFVTSSSRDYMRTVRRLFPPRSCLLQNVDSFLLTEEAFKILTSTLFWGESQLGCFRLVDVYQYAEVADAVHYWTDKGPKLAGIPRNHWMTGQREFEYVTPVKSRDVISRGPSPLIEWRKGRRLLGGLADEDIYGADGWALDWTCEQADRERAEEIKYEESLRFRESLLHIEEKYQKVFWDKDGNCLV